MDFDYDLNLISILNALIEEASITKAAERLRVSPATVSRAINKLRSNFGDPILVQSGRNMVLTPWALSIKPRVAQILAAAKNIFQQSENINFSGLKPNFRIRAVDAFLGQFSSKILQTLQIDCKDTMLTFVAESDEEDKDFLRKDGVDLYIGGTKNLPPEIMRQTIFSTTFVGVVRDAHPILLDEITPERLVQYNHISVSRKGQRHGPIDEVLLDQFNLTRSVPLLIPSFYTALQMVAETDLILSVPDVIIERSVFTQLGLFAFPLPFKLPAVTIYQAWHPRLDSDPLHKWLRQSVVKVTHSLK